VNNSRLQHFPVSFFSMILGLAGFTIAFQKMEELLHLSIKISNYLIGFTFLLAIVLGIFYLAKSIKYFDEIVIDFNHPIKMNFTPTIFIVFLMASIIMMPINMQVSKILWIIGTTGQAIIFLNIISKWMHNSNIEIHHFNPSWFIPAVGNILIPISGIKHFHPEISWLFFSIGLVFWIVLLIVFYNRIFFHHPLPEKLTPTLFLLIAPPAVGFISYIKLTGQIDPFAKVLYYFALFNFIVLIVQFDTFKKIKFYLSWWAYSFPITAFTISSILFYHKTQIELFKYIAIAVFAIAILLIIFLIYRTIIAIFVNKEICIEE